MTAFSSFRAGEIATAVAVAAVAQLAFVGLFLLPPPPAVEADISDDRARPLSVAVTPVALLALGSPQPAKLPESWRRKTAPAAPAKTPAATPEPDRVPAPPPPMATIARSAIAASEAGAASVDPAGVGPASTPGEVASSDAGPPEPSSSVVGAPEGSPDGTETDPLKARAADMYRSQLAAWFAARFAVRGKIPFETLKTLKAIAVVSVTNERRVSGFSITRPSGDAAFDEEVRAALSRIQSSGVELPAPPPAYPEILTRSVPVSFRCTVRAQCE